MKELDEGKKNVKTRLARSKQKLCIVNSSGKRRSQEKKGDSWEECTARET